MVSANGHHNDQLFTQTRAKKNVCSSQYRNEFLPDVVIVSYVMRTFFRTNSPTTCEFEKKTMAINEFNGNGLAISSALVGLVVRYSIRSHIVDAYVMKKITANFPIEFPFEMQVKRHKSDVKKQH